MNDRLSFPPLRDLPPGHLEARKQRLLDEIAPARDRFGFSLPTFAVLNCGRSLRGALVIAASVAALAGTSVAIAAGFGAFNGISAAQHSPTGADALDAKTLAGLQQACPSEIVQGPMYVGFCHLALDSARLVGNVPSYGNVYVVSDTHDELCTIIDASGASCSPPLSNSQPITFAFFNDSPTTGGTFVAAGIAMDGVESVSFTVNGEPVTTPVQDNTWVYEKANSHATLGDCVVAHLSDGSAVDPAPEPGCS